MPLLLILGIALLLLRPPHTLMRLAARLLPQVVFVGPAGRCAVALSLDDGPHPSTTPAVLDTLRAHDAKATFFLLGEPAAAHPELVERIAAEGHELGNHGLRDERSSGLSEEALEASLACTHETLSRFGPVTLFRPGGGGVTRRVLDAAARHGYRCVLGSVYPQDARVRWRHYLVWDVLRRVRPGAIVILHEGRPERAIVTDVLDDVLPELALRGYEITTVSELLDSR